MSQPSPHSYTFLPDEKCGHGFYRILGMMRTDTKQLNLRSKTDPLETAHTLHTLIKRLRALLWFAQPILKSSLLRDAKKSLRQASRLLAPACDQRALQLTLHKIAPKIITIPIADQPTSPFLQPAATILLHTLESIEAQAPKKGKWPSATTRVDKAFKAMLQARKKVRQRGTTTNFHQWRKKTKRLLYELELTHARPGKRTALVIKQIDKLQDKLGDYHDCTLIQKRLRLQCVAENQKILLLLQKRKKHLRQRIRKIARHLYS